MRQVWIKRFGAPEVLETREAPDPAPVADQVRIRVRASGINFADIMARLGLYPDAPKPPCVVGYEVSGVVDAIGPDASEDWVGQRVLALTPFGGYGDCVAVSQDFVVSLPGSVSFEVGAGLGVNYLTAWLLLIDLAHVQEGETVLIHGVGGGVGLAAMQIARARGAHIIGTASSPKHDRLRALGVDSLIDYGNEDVAARVVALTEGRGVDVHSRSDRWSFFRP